LDYEKIRDKLKLYKNPKLLVSIYGTFSAEFINRLYPNESRDIRIYYEPKEFQVENLNIVLKKKNNQRVETKSSFYMNHISYIKLHSL
jgi:hypothetical protein